MIAVEKWQYQKMAISWYNNRNARQHNPTGSTHTDGKHNGGHEGKRQQPNRHRKTTTELPRKEARANMVPQKQGELPQGTAGKQGRKTQHKVKKQKRKEYEHPAHM